MNRKAAIVALVLVLSALGGLAVSDPGLPAGEYDSPILLPTVAKDAGAAPSLPGQGVSAGIAPGDSLALLRIGWYYAARPIYDGAEFVQYLDKPAAIARVVSEGAEPLSNPVMILNEPDRGTVDVGELVAQVVPLVERWEGTGFVGPCVSDADGLGLVVDFLALFQHQTGRPFPLAAVCLHCYGEASHCAEQVQKALALAEKLAPSLGYAPEVWLTEYQLTPEMDNTVRDQILSNGCLARFLAETPGVGRWAYWTAGIRYGDDAPSDPVTGWQPLLYPHWTAKGTEWRLTALGKAFNRDPPSWAECVDGGWLAAGQAPMEISVGLGLGLALLALLVFLAVVALWDSCFGRRWRR
jgi:hypothetical protein